MTSSGQDFSLLSLDSESKASKTVVFRHFICWLFLASICLAGMWRLEELSSPPKASLKKMNRTTVQATSSFSPKRCKLGSDGRMPPSCRAFIVMVDSLRDQTALDEKTMPFLGDLQKRSAFGVLQSCKDHVTTPCVRASMEGRYRRSIFSIVRNFSSVQIKGENLLKQAHQRGFKIYAASHERCFGIFKPALAKLDKWEDDQEALDQAVRAYQSNQYDIILLHLLDGDHVAHSSGVEDPAYYRSFREIDRKLKRLEQLVDRRESFFIYGDHGHAMDGSHKFGVETPSYYFMRSPLFQKDKKQKAHIKDVRFFLSRVFELPLPSNYQGQVYPALSKGKLTSDALVHLNKKVKERSFVARIGFWLAVVLFAVYGLLWFLLLVGADEKELPVQSFWLTFPVAWLGLFIGFGFSGWLGFGMSLLIGLGLLRVWRRSLPMPYWEEQAALAFVLPLFFVLWGMGQFHFRNFLHDIWWRYFISYAIGAGLFAALLGFFLPLRYSLHLLWVGAVFLLLPSVYHYGAMSSLFFVLIAFGLFIFLRPSARFGKQAVPFFPQIQMAKFYAFASIFPLQLFSYIESESFLFGGFLGWRLYVDPSIWRLIALFVLAKLLLYSFSKARWSVWLFMLPLGAGVGYCEYYQLHFVSGILAAFLGLLWFALFLWQKKKREETSSVIWKQLIYPISFASLQLSLVYFHRIPLKMLIGFNLFLAILELLCRSVRKLSFDQELRSVAPIILAVVGYLGSFWFTLRWGFGHMEWRSTYDFLTAEQAEHFVVLVTLSNLIKYLLPLFLVRVLLQKHFPEEISAIQRRVRLWIGLKVLTLLCLCYGLSAFHHTTRIADEGIQQLILTLVVQLGIFI